MKKKLLTLLLACFALSGMAQFGYYHDLQVSYEKYFVSASYGTGTSYWNSHLRGTDLLNKDGSTLLTGNIDFKAKNSTDFYDLSVQFPIAKIRYGFGLSFEQFFLDKLELPSTNKILLLDENFTFDKMYIQTEIPFFPNSKSPITINGNIHLGYFSYHGVSRLNFFGGDHIARSFYTTVGITSDFRLYPHCYVFVSPTWEYKRFRNSFLEYPSEVTHNINSFCFTAGIRIDLSKE